MSATGRLTLTVVTPERAVVEGAPCDTVTLPGEKGELGILPGHTPLVALLGVGRVAFSDGPRKSAVAVRGGFVEIAGDVVRVLADLAVEKDAIDVAFEQQARTTAEARRLTVVGEEELDVVNADLAYAEAKLGVARGA